MARVERIEVHELVSLPSAKNGALSSDSGPFQIRSEGKGREEADPQDGSADMSNHDPTPQESQASEPASTGLDGVLENSRENLISDLHPIDGGFQAWNFLACAFTIELMVYGTSYSYGSFQDYHLSNPASPLHQRSASATTISLIGTMVIGGVHFVPLLTRGLLVSYPHLVRKLGFASLICSSLSLLISSFLVDARLLILFQGLLFGLTSGTAFTPVALWLPQWFDRRRGLATGVIFAGSGIGGVIFPLVLNVLLNRLGFANTLRIWSALNLLLVGMALYRMTPRLKPLPPPTGGASDGGRRLRRRGFKGFLKDISPGSIRGMFLPIAIVNSLILFTQASGWYTISLYLSSYATSLGLSKWTSTGVLSSFNASAILGYMMIGNLIDRFDYTRLMLVSGLVCSLSSLVILGLANSLVMVLIFTLIFGAGGGGFACFLTPVSRDVAYLENQESSISFFYYVFVRGVAALSGPPIASSLYRSNAVTTSRPSSSEYGARGFRGLVLYVGLMMFATFLLALVAYKVRRWSYSQFDRERNAPAPATTPQPTDSRARDGAPRR
ncbi:MFS general substrate transporter [Violaceomyces palustris]|uniref:MFS general substrate transporter n=1 Tax=Violaceomyces palustris TaxID=1673888 RepID=A0ACD0NNN2_9BASI|nr:MFS general substrate transporter [Violaceomyces palustris]